MIPIHTRKDQHMAVFGLGASGLAAAAALTAGGADVLAWDDDADQRDRAAASGIALADLYACDWGAVDALVLAPGIPLTHPPHRVVELAARADCPVLGDVELLVESCPRSRFIAITGTNGKSTTTALTGHVLSCFKFPMAAVMRPLDNAYLNRFLVSTRKRNGLALFDKKGLMANAESFIENGGLLGFIGDQDAGRKGLFVEFFGRPASTYKSIGLLAMRLKRPIVVGYARRRGHRAQYEVGVQQIIRPEEWETKNDPLRWVTQEYTSAIEAMVRRNPEQYLWIHRRWKSRPKSKTGAPGDSGPATPSQQTEAAIGSPNRTG